MCFKTIVIIKRNTYKNLLDWKTNEERRPLLLRGARQVGKTTLIRQFSKEFDSYIELNLERERDLNLFIIDDVKKILNKAAIDKNIEIKNSSTLLFIDEIQESPKAIKLLRYFYEDLPNIFVIAAGSLLEFSLHKIPSFPVGRVDYLYLHPINFNEFLNVFNQQAKKVFNKIPIVDYAHSVLLDLFNEYTIIGGMPEIISNYKKKKSVANVTKIYNKIWQAYKDDAEKYARNHTIKNVIRHVINTAPNEKDRIKFEQFGNSNYRSREVGEALRSLDLARIISLIYPSTSIELPIQTNYKKRPRLQFLDTGLLNYTQNLQGELLLLKDFSNHYRGNIIQHIIYQELISIFNETPFKPNFWVREDKNSNSEVDLVYQYKNVVIPIEIKAGKTGTLKSLHQFINRTNHPYAVRIFAGNFCVEKLKTPEGTPYLLMNLPYYLGTKIPKYITYFIKNHKL